MRVQLSQEQLAVLLPEEPGLRAHCRRVAAIAREIAAALSLPGRALPVLEQAALLHHNAALRPASSLDRLLRELFARTKGEDATFVRAQNFPEDLAAALSAFHGPPVPGQDQRIRTMADVLLVSDVLDEQMEMMSLEPKTMAGLWQTLKDATSTSLSRTWGISSASARTLHGKRGAARRVPGQSGLHLAARQRHTECYRPPQRQSRANNGQ